ncbi:MAG: hypothetical protein AAFZ87_10295, partial [Planctomycetota bacterium]
MDALPAVGSDVDDVTAAAQDVLHELLVGLVVLDEQHADAPAQVRVEHRLARFAGGLDVLGLLRSVGLQSPERAQRDLLDRGARQRLSDRSRDERVSAGLVDVAPRERRRHEHDRHLGLGLVRHERAEECVPPGEIAVEQHEVVRAGNERLEAGVRARLDARLGAEPLERPRE